MFRYCNPTNIPSINIYSKEEEALSIGSTVTLTQQDTLTTCLPQAVSETETETSSVPNSPRCYDDRKMKRSSTLTNEKEDDEQNKEQTTSFSRRFSNVSAATMTNVRTSAKNCSKSDPVQYFQNDLISQTHSCTIYIHAVDCFPGSPYFACQRFASYLGRVEVKYARGV